MAVAGSGKVAVDRYASLVQLPSLLLQGAVSAEPQSHGASSSEQSVVALQPEARFPG